MSYGFLALTGNVVFRIFNPLEEKMPRTFDPKNGKQQSAFLHLILKWIRPDENKPNISSIHVPRNGKSYAEGLRVKDYLIMSFKG